MKIENIKQLMDGLDLAALFPEIESVLDLVAVAARFLLLIGPFVLLALGLFYFLGAPKEANYQSGYRCYWGMGSVMAWQFTQRLAGSLYAISGIGLVVAMAILGASLHGCELMTMLLRTVRYIAIQAVTVLIVRIIINLTVTLRYDR